MNNTLKAGAILAVASMVYLISILLSSPMPLNLATWTLWVVIDVAVTLSLYRSGKSYLMMLVFTVGTAVIVAISLHNYLLGSATFVWSIKETITVFIVMLALVVWKFTNDDTGVITTTFAMVVAGVPVWIDTYHAPATQNILFWSIATGSCMLTYIGSPKKFIARFMPFCGAASNMLIILLACRKFL